MMVQISETVSRKLLDASSISVRRRGDGSEQFEAHRDPSDTVARNRELVNGPLEFRANLLVRRGDGLFNRPCFQRYTNKLPIGLPSVTRWGRFSRSGSIRSAGIPRAW